MSKKLERIEKLEKKLKARKRKILAKEYEKLGREFYKKSQAKSLSEAEKMLQHISVFQNKESDLTANQYQQLQAIANGMKWTGNYWQIDNLKEVSNCLSQFRKESPDSEKKV